MQSGLQFILLHARIDKEMETILGILFIYQISHFRLTPLSPLLTMSLQQIRLPLTDWDLWWGLLRTFRIFENPVVVMTTKAYIDKVYHAIIVSAIMGSSLPCLPSLLTGPQLVDLQLVICKWHFPSLHRSTRAYSCHFLTWIRSWTLWTPHRGDDVQPREDRTRQWKLVLLL